MAELKYDVVNDDKIVKVKDLINFLNGIERGEFLPENKKQYKKLKEFFEKIDRL